MASRNDADETIALALASGRTQAEAAELAGVCRKTVSRRVASPAFAARVRELRAEAVARAVGVLSEGMVVAAAALRLLLTDSADERTRLRAADLILGHGLRGMELLEVVERVAELERRLAARGGQGACDAASA